MSKIKIVTSNIDLGKRILKIIKNDSFASKSFKIISLTDSVKQNVIYINKELNNLIQEFINKLNIKINILKDNDLEELLKNSIKEIKIQKINKETHEIEEEIKTIEPIVIFDENKEFDIVVENYSENNDFIEDLDKDDFNCNILEQSMTIEEIKNIINKDKEIFFNLDSF